MTAADCRRNAARRRCPPPRWLIAAVAAALATPAVADDRQPAGSAPARDLPADVLSALGQIEDYSFRFDQPGFYAVVAAVRGSPLSPGHAEPPLKVDDWQDLLARPGEFRGRPVRLNGVVGRNKDPFLLPQHPELGELSQLEVSRDDQPPSCTLILTSDATDIPVGAAIEFTGYFVMIRQYYGPSGRVQPAALVVSPGPASITARARPADRPPTAWPWLVGAIVAGLVVAVVLMRTAGRVKRPDYHDLRASVSPSANLHDDLARLADETSPQNVGDPHDDT